MRFYPRALTSSVIAWIAFDFVNSILIINGSIYYSQWLVESQGVNVTWYNIAFMLSTAALLMASLVVGGRIDMGASARTPLLLTSLAMGFFTIFLAALTHSSSVPIRIVGTLVMFAMINFCYQLSLVPYNWVLPKIVSSPSDVTRVTGWGEAFGSFGSVVGALLGGAMLQLPVFGNGPGGAIMMVFTIALIYLSLFTVDFNFLKKGFPTDKPAKKIPWSVRPHFAAALQTLDTLPAVKRYMFAFMLYADTLLTVQLNLPVFFRQAVRLSETQLRIAYADALCLGAVGAFAFSRLSTRFSLRQIIVGSLLLWIVLLLSFGLFAMYPAVFWVTISLSGIAFGMLWSASKAYLYLLASEAHLGRGFGLYSVFERCASILGPFIWGFIMWFPQDTERKYLCAFVAMSFCLVVSILLLCGCFDDERVRSTAISPTPGAGIAANS